MSGDISHLFSTDINTASVPQAFLVLFHCSDTHFLPPNEFFKWLIENHFAKIYNKKTRLKTEYRQKAFEAIKGEENHSRRSGYEV
jgi:hypothetical protein